MLSTDRGQRGHAQPRETTQIDDTLRLPWCTDVQPEPTQYPKHGSHDPPRRPARRSRVCCGSGARWV